MHSISLGRVLRSDVLEILVIHLLTVCCPTQEPWAIMSLLKCKLTEVKSNSKFSSSATLPHFKGQLAIPDSVQTEVQKVLLDNDVLVIQDTSWKGSGYEGVSQGLCTKGHLLSLPSVNTAGIFSDRQTDRKMNTPCLMKIQYIFKVIIMSFPVSLLEGCYLL